MRVWMDLGDVAEIKRLAEIVLRCQEAIAPDRDEASYGAAGQIIEMVRRVKSDNDVEDAA